MFGKILCVERDVAVLYRSDVDGWLATRFSARPSQDNKTALTNTPLTGSALKEGIQKSQQLRATRCALSEKIHKSIRLLTENCNDLTSQTVREPSLPASTVAPEPSPDSLPDPQGSAWL
jgi:hypothetical protein